MRGAAQCIATSIAFALVATVPTAAQSVADIVDQMYEAVERYGANVDNYTLVHSVMGFESVTYFEKEVVDGRVSFQPRQSDVNGMPGNVGDQGVGYADVAELGPALVEYGRYAGRGVVDGHAVHLIHIEDFSALELEAPSGPEDMDFEAKSGQISVDAELFVPRRMEFEGQATTDTGTHDVTTVVDMLDYREVGGLLISHKTVIKIQGIDAMIDPDMQARLEEMQAQLDSMDPDRRAMLEQMLGPQMRQIQEMASGDGGPMTMEITVTDVRINQGPPR